MRVGGGGVVVDSEWERRLLLLRKRRRRPLAGSGWGGGVVRDSCTRRCGSTMGECWSGNHRPRREPVATGEGVLHDEGRLKASLADRLGAKWRRGSRRRPTRWRAGVRWRTGSRSRPIRRTDTDGFRGDVIPEGNRWGRLWWCLRPGQARCCRWPECRGRVHFCGCTIIKGRALKRLCCHVSLIQGCLLPIKLSLGEHGLIPIGAITEGLPVFLVISAQGGKSVCPWVRLWRLAHHQRHASTRHGVLDWERRRRLFSGDTRCDSRRRRAV